MAEERRTKRRFDTNSPAPIRDRDPWPRQPEDGPIPLFDHFEDTRKAAKSLACRNRAIEDASACGGLLSLQSRREDYE
ncbi:hypothetical protein F2Q68_00010302 [Brassica cretica]|uniref:Uncharacterized protein n=1 Tax=Brassica cretica TaxID=69181 RepID=A0A8S9KMX2_BRACR|nr:hypothetical protein F2Q68_00010302 [Brassica cretica]